MNIRTETESVGQPRRIGSRRNLVRSSLLASTLLASTLAGNLVSTTPIQAALTVNEPPVTGHQIISFPARDFVTGSGYLAADGPFTVQVLRGGVVIGTSDPAMPDSGGLLQINHPAVAPDPTYCWVGTTPDILPGDQVRVLNAAGTVADQTTTANVTAAFPVQLGAGVADATGVLRYTIQVHGTAQDALGAPLPVGQVESRLVANKQAFDLNGRRTIRAGGAGKDGTFAYDAVSATNPAGINWTATYTGLDQHDRDMALSTTADQSRAIWLGRNPLAATELTIFEANQVTPGPQAPCTAPLGAAAPAAGADTVAPSIPTGVGATVSLGNNVTVSWTASTDNVGVTGYDVFRDTVAVGKVGAPNTSFTEVGVPDGTHTYTVDAFDAAGNHSAQSAASPGVLTAAPAPLPAGVSEPPVAGHQIISFPARDFVTASGYLAADGPFRVQVIRNGAVLGTSDPAMPDSGGLLQINHPAVAPDPTYCWVGTTPNILPGDQVRVINAKGIADQTTTANVTSAFPVQVGAGVPDAKGVLRYTIQVHGTAQDALGRPLPLAAVENRLVINKLQFDLNGRRTIRAGGAGTDGTMVYDAVSATNPAGINWTATYTGLDQHDRDLALSATADQSRAIWLGNNPLAATELTIFEANLVTPGPQAPCTAPLVG